MFPIKYIDNNLVWNKDNEVFAYYELIPYNYSFLSAEQKFIVHDSFRQLIAQSREGKIHALQIATESSIRSMQEQSKKLVTGKLKEVAYQKIDEQTEALVSMIGDNQVDYRFFLGFKLMVTEEQLNLKNIKKSAWLTFTEFLHEVNHTLMNDFVSMPNDEINRYMKMEKLLENKISRRFKVRRLEINDFGYLMEHLYGRDGIAYEDYEYQLPKKKLNKETLIKYYDLIRPTSSQWETFQPKNRSKNGWLQYAKKYTKLKSGFIVRYADDFKIMCSTYGEAQRFYHSTVDFLNKRLKLEISPEKSKVVNLKKNSSDFLGFKIKVIPKGRTKHGYVAKTDMNQKALKKAKTNLKLKVKDIARHTTGFNISRYNLTVIGMQNYYCIATNVYNNLTEVSYALLPTIRIRLRNIAKSVPFESTSSEFQSRTKGIRPKTKIVMIADNPLLPIQGVQHKNPMNFSQDICNFTKQGRNKVHDDVVVVTKEEIRELLENEKPADSVEFNDNRISAYIAQQGNCYVMNRRGTPSTLICIHKSDKGDNLDRYSNLAFVEIPIAKAILTESADEAKSLLKGYVLNSQQKKKLNRIRTNYGYQTITGK